MSAAMSLTLAAIHVVVWLQDRKRWANFTFSITALAVASFAACEFGLMHTDSAERFSALMRWVHVPLFVLVVGVVRFVGLYFGTGRWWLGCAAVGVRLVSLVLNFIFAPNLNYREISSLKQIEFLGERVWVVAQSVPSHRNWIVELSSLLALIFVVDASLTLWRKGGPEARRGAALVGGSITLFIIVAAVLTSLIHIGVLHIPYLVSFPFLAIVVAMGYELSRDMIRAARMPDELRENAESMSTPK
jgi:hypothetical protein